jgi:hypothetical protein
VKIRLKMTIRCAPGEDAAAARFKRIKTRIKGMGEGELAGLILDAVERQLDAGRVGFRTRGG